MNVNIVIVHYHLYPGGVTKIIRSQIEGIRYVTGRVRIMVLTGHPDAQPEQLEVNLDVFPALFYMDPGLPVSAYKEARDLIIAAIRKNLTRKAVLHVHNPNLGKNPALTMAVHELARLGYLVINHCHDFPEDRPDKIQILEKIIPEVTEMHLSQVLYPVFPGYHYFVINTTDYNRLVNRSIPVSNIHLLFNPVKISSIRNTPMFNKKRQMVLHELGLDERKKICTYPVRAIRRKNIGEFVLIAALYSNDVNFTITQSPRNPDEIPRYLEWKHFCEDLGLEIIFESGTMIDYEELINISDFCVTTSVLEGFGMVYLEPWMAGTPVVGRDLPWLTDDLKGYGVEFQRLYKSVNIETSAGKADFKDLEPDMQQEVVRRVKNDPAFRVKLLNDNPVLATLFNVFPADVIQRNQNIIKSRFSVEHYGKRLLEIYRTISR